MYSLLSICICIIDPRLLFYTLTLSCVLLTSHHHRYSKSYNTYSHIETSPIVESLQLVSKEISSNTHHDIDTSLLNHHHLIHHRHPIYHHYNHNPHHHHYHYHHH